SKQSRAPRTVPSYPAECRLAGLQVPSRMAKYLLGTATLTCRLFSCEWPAMRDLSAPKSINDPKGAKNQLPKVELPERPTLESDTLSAADPGLKVLQWSSCFAYGATAFNRPA